MKKSGLKALGLALLMIVCVQPAYAGEAIVNDEVNVDVTGKDGADARDQAMAKGEVDALLDLLGKLTPPGQAQDIVAKLDARKIAGMVRGTQVMDEKISSNRYRASLQISFDADAISELVGKGMAGNPAAADNASAANSFLIIPAFDDNGGLMLWEDKNPWRSIWKQLGVEINSGDIVVAYGDNNDAAILNTQNLASANYAMLAPLAIRYGVSDIVILQATYTKDPDMALSVVKRRINRNINEVSMQTYRADAQETRDMLLTRAARDIAENLRTRKTQEIAAAKEVSGVGESNKMMLLASITTLNSWTQLRSKLTALPMVDRIELLALSAQQVDMIVYYRGTAEGLATGISGSGLRIARNPNYWVVSRD